MILHGVPVQIEWGYTVSIWQAYQDAWTVTADGQYKTNDRPQADRRIARFRIAEPEDAGTLAALFNGGQSGITACGLGEEIFGADVVYTDPLMTMIRSIGAHRRETLVSGTIEIELELLVAPPTFGASLSLDTLHFPHSRDEGLSRSGAALKYYSIGGTAFESSGFSKTQRMTFVLTTEQLRGITNQLLSVRTGRHSLHGRDIIVLRWGECAREAFDVWTMTMEFVDVV